MICEDMKVGEAIEHVKKCRRIIPNWGFMKQLRELDMQLLERRNSAEQSWHDSQRDSVEELQNNMKILLVYHLMQVV